MRLTPRDLDKLVLHQAGFLAQKRYARGLKLNHPEATALIASQLLEFIREGDSVSKLMNKGKCLLGLNDVMPCVAEIIHEVQIEGTFPDGTKLVTVHQPICKEAGDPLLALHGSGLQRDARPDTCQHLPGHLPGETLIAAGELTLNAGRETCSVTVTNHGDRPVQVGSHYPFFETNAALVFDRQKAFGMRLHIPAGTAVRFEPGESKSVTLVRIAGEQIIYGGNTLTSGPTRPEDAEAAISRALEQNFGHQEASS